MTSTALVLRDRLSPAWHRHYREWIAQLQAELTAGRRRADNLDIALTTNREIGVAMGILMAHHRLTQQEAFTALRIVSQRTHRKLRDIASDVALTGALD